MLHHLALAAALAAAPAPNPPAPSMTPAGLQRYQAAASQLQAGNNAAALQTLNALANESPLVGEVFAARCSAFLGLGNPLAAAGDCGRALGLKPGYPPALYGLATAHDVLGRPAEAADLYRRYAASQDPNAFPDFKARAAARADQLAPPAAAPVAPASPDAPPAPAPAPVAAPAPAGGATGAPVAYPGATAAAPAAPAQRPLGPECFSAKGQQLCSQFTLPLGAEDPVQVLTRALALNGQTVAQSNPQAGMLVTGWQNTNFGYGFINLGREAVGAKVWRRYLVVVARADRSAVVTVRLESRRCTEGTESPDGLGTRFGECVEFPEGPVKKHEAELQELGARLKAAVGGT